MMPEVDYTQASFQDRRQSEASERPNLERRQFADAHSELSQEARELAMAIDNYKRLHRRRFITHEEMVAVIEGAVGKNAKLKKLPVQPGDVPQTYADLGKARRLLGYGPSITFAEGVRRFVAWYREQQRAGK